MNTEDRIFMVEMKECNYVIEITNKGDKDTQMGSDDDDDCMC